MWSNRRRRDRTNVSKRANLKSAKSPHIEILIVGAAVLASIVLHGVFIIRGFGEADAARLVVAAQEWHMTGRALYQSYIFRTSPLYIHTIKAMLGAGVSPSALPAVLNWAAVVISSLALIPLYLLWRRIARRGVATIACILLFFTPAYWLTGMYGMAHLPAFSLFVVGLTLFTFALKKKGKTQTLMLAGAVATAMVGVAFKADMVLCYGAFLGAALWARAAKRRIVLWSLAIPALSFLGVTIYARLIAPSLSGVTSFAGAWSNNFPFTLSALTDEHNRSVLLNSTGAVLSVFILLAVADRLFRRRNLRELAFAGFWALPPILFWGLRLGNSARHMMAAIPVLLLIVGIVLVFYLRSSRLRGLAVIAVLALNYAVGPSEGDAKARTSKLHVLQQSTQSMVDHRHRGARSFATFPVPRKMFVGGPGAPYALFEVMVRSKEIETYEGEDRGTALEIELVEEWPRYVATYGEGIVYTIRIKQVTGPYKMPPVEDWFTVSIEPLIQTRNKMSGWRPLINDAVRQNPKSVEEWATSGAFKSEAGLALTETGHLEEALEMFEAALAARPNNADVIWNTAMLSGHFGRMGEARKLLQRFVSLHPEDDRVEMARELLRESDPAAPSTPGD